LTIIFFYDTLPNKITISLEWRISMSDKPSKEAENTTKNSIKEDIKIEQLRPYKNNPFSIPTGKVFHEMITSIREEGILQEILARFTEDKDSSGNPIYEIISGHTRIEAAKKAGLAVVPVKVIDMNDDEAAIKVVESNFMRTTSTPSELGKAFKLRLDAIKKQGERTDLTSGQNKHKTSRDEIAVLFGISPSKVQRLIRLTKLIPEFQKKVDEKEITLSIAENISHLSEKEQSALNTILNQGIALPLYINTFLLAMLLERLKISALLS